MYESQIVEVEDMNFCHYINHFDEYEKDYVKYNDIYDLDTIFCDEESDEDLELDY